MRSAVLTVVSAALAVMGCEKAKTGQPTSEAVAAQPSNECSAEKLSNVTSTWGGWEPHCDLGNERGKGSERLVVSDIDLTPGRALKAVIADARLAKAKVISEAGETTLFFEEDVPAKYGSPFNEWRRYVLAVQAGKVTGIRACENFESGKYRNRLNQAAIAAYGLPSSFSLDNVNVYMGWTSGVRLHISGSPNFSLLTLGEEPPSFAGRDGKWQRRLFNELVREEDKHPGDTEAARTEVALRHCMTTQELASRMITELNSGTQPDDEI